VDVGFCDQSNFGAVFYKHVGITPAAYRRRYQNMGLTDLSEFPTKSNGNPEQASQCSE
jgi:AraC-like DNA-binding protein